MWLMWPYLEHGMEEEWVIDGEGKHDGSCDPTLNMAWKRSGL